MFDRWPRDFCSTTTVDSLIVEWESSVCTNLPDDRSLSRRTSWDSISMWKRPIDRSRSRSRSRQVTTTGVRRFARHSLYSTRSNIRYDEWFRSKWSWLMNCCACYFEHSMKSRKMIIRIMIMNIYCSTSLRSTIVRWLTLVILISMG